MLILIMSVLLFCSTVSAEESKDPFEVFEGGYVPLPMFCGPAPGFMKILKRHYDPVTNWVEIDGENIITYWKRIDKSNKEEAHKFMMTITFTNQMMCILSMGDDIIERYKRA